MLLEAINNITKKVRIFDFDDTLVKTNSLVYLTNSGQEVSMTPAQFAIYKQKPGDTFDFSDFEQVSKPKLIRQNITILKQQVGEGKKIVILTARANYEPIKRFFAELNLTPYVVALGDADPKAKVNYIESLIKQGYDDIAFMDDSRDNVIAVNGLSGKYPHIKLVLKHHKQ